MRRAQGQSGKSPRPRGGRDLQVKIAGGEVDWIESMRMTAEWARRGFKLPGFISINTAVATVCASSAGDRSSSAPAEEVENEKRNEGAGEDRKNES